MTIGERINQTRISREMTLEAVGNAIGVTRATIQKYENGLIANIPFDKIESIARVLRVTPSYLVGWDESDTLTPYQRSFLNDPMVWDIFNKILQLTPSERKQFMLLLDNQIATLQKSSDQ